MYVYKKNLMYKIG